MPINPGAVGVKGEPSTRSWTSKDALQYAAGVGAGTDELAFTTENTKETPHVLVGAMGGLYHVCHSPGAAFAIAT